MDLWEKLIWRHVLFYRIHTRTHSEGANSTISETRYTMCDKIWVCVLCSTMLNLHSFLLMYVAVASAVASTLSWYSGRSWLNNQQINWSAESRYFEIHDMKSSKQASKWVSEQTPKVYNNINVIHVDLFTWTVSPILMIIVGGIFREWQMENVNRGCIVIQLLLANHNGGSTYVCAQHSNSRAMRKKLMCNTDEINKNGT